jgi:hypothetical protein
MKPLARTRHHRVGIDLTHGWPWIALTPSGAREAETAFTAVSLERAQVVLTHRHLERHGQGWQQMHDAVAGGWSLAPLARRIFAANQVAGRPLPVISDEMMRSRLLAARRYTAVVLRQGQQYGQPSAAAIVWEHGRRNMALAQAGLLAVVLPVDDDSQVCGIGAFTTNEADTGAIMADDPGVRAAVFTYDLHPVRGFPGATLP